MVLNSEGTCINYSEASSFYNLVYAIIHTVGPRLSCILYAFNNNKYLIIAINVLCHPENVITL